MIGPPWQPRRAVRWTGSRWSPSSETPAALPPTLRVLTWNVLWDKYNPEALASHQRWPRLLDAALATRADLIALQEVTRAVHDLVLDHPAVRAGWWVSHPRGHSDIGPYDLLWLGRKPTLSLGFLPLEARKGALAVALPGLILCTTHLSSDHRTGAPRRRQAELDRIGAALSPPFAIVGDLNCETVQLPGSVDAWTSVHATPPEPTFDPTLNPLATHASRTGRPRHIDRMLLHGPRAVSAHRIGTTPIDGVWPSDHAGVVFQLQPPPTPAAHPHPSERPPPSRR
ncbi:MAG: poly(A) polymerase [Myxococcota bacterium]